MKNHYSIARALMLLCLAACAACNNAPVVTVEGGAVRGVKEGKVLVYKGIPFAAPPVGALRGKDPSGVIPWKGVLNCNRFAPAAVQAPFPHYVVPYYREFYSDGDPEFSEDCLYLNVWTPACALKEGSCDLPVAVWIHGGSLDHGYSYEKEMDGAAWAQRGVVLVTIAYRLGEIGFPADGSLLGFKDQIAALRWVKSNIASFGGDPSRVTVFGQSAGAISVKYILADPEGRSLVKGAILQSGGGISPMDIGLPEGTRGEVLRQALEDGAFDGIPVMAGFTAQDPDILGRPATLEMADALSEREGARVYVYEFARNLPGESPSEEDPGAFHSAELWYMFGTLSRCWRPFTEEDYRLSDKMLDQWTSFVRDSHPGYPAYSGAQKHIEILDVRE
mgnify:CR=1 FL=1